MTDSEIIQLESYFLTENKEEYIKKLINGTDSYYYFSLISALNKYGIQLPKEYEDNLEKYKKFTTVRSRNIQLRALLYKLEKATTEEERKNLASEINRLIFHYDFRFEQPKSVTTTNLISHEEKISNSLDLSLIDVTNYLKNASKTVHDLNALNSAGQTKLVLKNFENADLNLIRTLLTNLNLADFEGVPQFLKHYNDLQRAKAANFQLENFLFPKMTLEQLKELQTLLPEINKSMHFIGE